MGRFRMKPVEVEALRYLGLASLKDLEDFEVPYEPAASWNIDYTILIKTVDQSLVAANVGDWIIKGVHAGYYPCKDDVFRSNYERLSYYDTGILS